MNSNSSSIFRIIFESREKYKITDDNNQIYRAEMSGAFRDHSNKWPAVGDYITGRIQPGDWVVIDEVLERKGALIRKDPDNFHDQVLAANVDILFIVTSANDDLNMGRLNRYVLMATQGNTVPVIVINKIELSEDASALMDNVAKAFPNIDVHGVSIHENLNFESVKEYFCPNVTVAVVGSSGVGKSSLINKIIGFDLMDTGGIREDDDKGRHTTTHRELTRLDNGAFIIDTPGLRSLGLTSEVRLEDLFAEIETMASQCKFSDCHHETEPDCSIRNALQSGQLNAAQWKQFQKLKRELEHEKRRADKALQSAEKKRWSKIHQDVRVKMKVRRETGW